MEVGLIKKDFCCISCKQVFELKDFNLKGLKLNFPTLLQCGHTICRNCRQEKLNSAKQNNNCEQCRVSLLADINDLSNIEYCINHYVVGYLMTFQTLKNKKYKEVKYVTPNEANFCYNLKKKKNLLIKLNVKLCSKCSSEAEAFCQKCDYYFCGLCWSKFHSSKKMLSGHSKLSLHSNKNCGLSIRKCNEHEFQNLEFYCEECCVEVCIHCIILNHQGKGHCTIKLEEKNEEIIKSLEKEVQEAQLISQRLEDSIKNLIHLSEHEEREVYKNFKHQISQNFCRLHGILQLEEEKLLRNLSKGVTDRKNCVNSICEQLKIRIENISELLDQWKAASKNSKVDDLINLHKSFLKVKELPCTFDLKKLNQKVKIDFEEAVIDSLYKYCTINVPPIEIKDFLLAKTNNYIQNDNLEIANIDDSSLKIKSDNEMFSLDSEGRNNDYESSTIDLIEKRSYSIRVAYIKHPEEFYITLNYVQTKQNLIDKIAWKAVSLGDEIPKAVTKDEIYLLKSIHEKKSYRVRIVEVFSLSEVRKIITDQKVLIFFLDYGYLKIESISNLRHIPKHLLAEPPLAIKCKLFDCVSKNEKWCEKSIEVMKTILGRGVATMFVLKIHPDVVEVDLSKFDEESRLGNEIVSVRDALIFLEFTNFVTGQLKPLHYSEEFSKQILPAVGDNFEIIISHINSTSDFYVQKVSSDLNYLYTLNENLQATCNENTEKRIIYNPKIGMPCAALFSGDQKWYRAKIVEIPGSKKLKVFYVDYGNEEIVEWTSVRKINKTFIKIPPLALNCSVSKSGCNGYASINFDLLSKYFLHQNYRNDSDELFYVKILEKNKANQKLEVFIYKKKNNGRYLNQDMNGIEKWYRKPILCQTKEEEKHNLILPEENLESSREFYEFVHKEGSFDKKKNVREKMESENERSYQLSVLNAKCGSVNNVVGFYLGNEKDIFRVRIIVLSAMSPSIIYVTLPELLIELQKLQKKIDEFYEDSLPDETIKWTVDSKCAVYLSEKNTWLRASIIEIPSSGKVKVFATDVAKIFTVSVFSLRKLDSSFSKFITCSIKCHLGGICPPADVWPATSCEFLIRELEAYEEIYLTRKGEINTLSLPVELWVQKVIPGTALDPIIREWVCLNRLLINEGLAIPLPQKEK